MDKLSQFRQRIDAIDEKIVTLIHERLGICREVAVYKSENQIPMMQPERVKEVLERRRKLAADLELNPEMIKEIYALIVKEACIIEDEIIDSLAQKANK